METFRAITKLTRTSRQLKKKYGHSHWRCTSCIFISGITNNIGWYLTTALSIRKIFSWFHLVTNNLRQPKPDMPSYLNPKFLPKPPNFGEGTIFAEPKTNAYNTTILLLLKPNFSQIGLVAMSERALICSARKINK